MEVRGVDKREREGEKVGADLLFIQARSMSQKIRNAIGGEVISLKGVALQMGYTCRENAFISKQHF